MIKEVIHLLRFGPAMARRSREMGTVEFMKNMNSRADDEGFAELRSCLVGDLKGDVLEIGAGTGSTFRHYTSNAKVKAIEPDDDFREAAIETSKESEAEIQVIPGKGEKLPFRDSIFDVVSASLVFCSLASPGQTLEEIKRVLRPSGQIRLLEHVRSEHWAAGPVMDVLNPIWFRINKVGCNLNRNTVETVKIAGFKILDIHSFKLYTSGMPFAFPLRIIKAEKP